MPTETSSIAIVTDSLVATYNPESKVFELEYLEPIQIEAGLAIKLKLGLSENVIRKMADCLSQPDPKLFH